MRFNREPTLYLQVLAAVLALVVTFGFDGLTAEHAALITAFGGALLAAVNAALVRPIAPAAFTGLVGAAAALLAAYGLEFSSEQVGATQAIVVTALALITREQVTPSAGAVR